MRHNKKGFSGPILAGAMAVLALVLLTVILSTGQNIQQGLYDQAASATYAKNTTLFGQQSLESVGKQQPTIGLVVGAGIIIAVLIGAFAFMIKGHGGM